MYFSVVYVVFQDSDKWYLKLLKKNYRHCYLLIQERGFWLKVDSDSSITICKDYKIDGIIVKIKPHNARLLFNINTCVGMVKRYVGIRRLIFTPHRLYKYILNMR